MNVSSYGVKVTINGRGKDGPIQVTRRYLAVAESSDAAVERVRARMKDSLEASLSTEAPLAFESDVMLHGDVVAIDEAPSVVPEPLQVPRVIAAMQSFEFWRDASTEVRKLPRLQEKGETAEGVRLYCYSHAQSWRLQCRGFITLADGGKSDTFAMGCASLSADDLRALRDAITTELIRNGLEEQP